MRKWEKNKVADALGIESEVSPLELKSNSLVMNEIDKDIYHDLVDRYETMQENLENGLKEYAPYDYLSEDIFNSLFKYNAQMHDAEEMTAFSKLNHKIMGDLMESEDYEKLRQSTKFDLMGSAIGTEVMQEKAMEQIQYFKQQYLEKQQTGQDVDGADAGELIEQLNKAKGMQDAIDEFIDKAGGVDNMTPKEAMKLQQMLNELKKQEELIDQNEKGQAEFKQGMEKTMKDSSSHAKSEVDEVRETVEAWGLESGQSGKRISLERRKKAIKRIRSSERLKELTDLIGRFRRLASAKKKQRVPDGQSIKNVQTGNKLQDTLPSELVKLANKTTKKDFYQRYNQRQLLNYKKEEVKSTGRGPVIFCHDKSGSMDDSKDNWATAMALATLEIAQKEKRNFAYIPYNGNIMHNAVKDIPAGELDPDDVMDIAELNSSGGTDFEAPLKKALEFIKDNRFKKGDIVFVTDGHAGVSEEFLKEFHRIKEEKKFFVHTVLINVDGYASNGITDKFSDNTTTISDLAQLDEASADAIFNIIKDDSKFEQANSPDDADPTDEEQATGIPF